MSPENWISACQTFGNVAPREYMVPFPNLAALLEGRLIKDREQLLLDHPALTIGAFHERVELFRQMVSEKGVRPGTPVVLEAIAFPDDLALAFAIWTQGGVLALGAPAEAAAQVVLRPENLTTKITGKTVPHPKPHLEADAIWQSSGDRIIRLSHYNCLVNCYALTRRLQLAAGTRLGVTIPERDSVWVILQVLLPLYSGTILDLQTPDFRIGAGADMDLRIRRNWTVLENTKPPSLYVVPEHTAFVALGREALPFVDLTIEQDHFLVRGHAVMNGYLNEEETRRVCTPLGLRLEYKTSRGSSHD